MGFAVGRPTLTRFFSLHFLIPLVVAALTMVHLLILHQTGRRNPLGVSRNFDKVKVHPYFTRKDLFGFFWHASIFSWPMPCHTSSHSTRMVLFTSLRYSSIYSQQTWGS